MYFQYRVKVVIGTTQFSSIQSCGKGLHKRHTQVDVIEHVGGQFDVYVSTQLSVFYGSGYRYTPPVQELFPESLQLDFRIRIVALYLRHEAKEVGKGRTVARGLCLP